MSIIAGCDENASRQFAREIWDGVQAQMDQEKAKAVADMQRTAKELKERGSDWVDGRGQAIGSIPPRIYMRWAQMVPGCWQDKQFVDEFLHDNPACCAPGYKPRPNQTRHGVTFVNGQSIYQRHKANLNVIT